MPKERSKYRKYSTNMLCEAAKMVKEQKCQPTKLQNKWEFRGVRLKIFFLRILSKSMKKQTCLNWEGRSRSQLISK
jgi:hypothetical protein